MRKKPDSATTDVWSLQLKLRSLERQLEAELAEIRRIKANMLTVDEDGDNGVEFGLGME